MKDNDVNYKQFYEIATWADDLRLAAMNSLDGWHFFNQGYFDGIKKEDASVITNEAYCLANTVVFLPSPLFHIVSNLKTNGKNFR